MANIICVLSSKGGVGKSTISNIIASTLATDGMAVCLLDADPNTPQKKWFDKAKTLDGFPSTLSVEVDLDPDTIIATIEKASETNDVVVIDLEGRAGQAATYAMSQSDAVIIPMQASELDADQAAKSLHFLQQTQKISNRDIPHAILFSRVNAAIRTKSFKDLENNLLSAKIPVLAAYMNEREPFKDVFFESCTLPIILSERGLLARTADTEYKNYKKEIEALDDDDPQNKARLKELRKKRGIAYKERASHETKIKSVQKARKNAVDVVAAIINLVNGERSAALLGQMETENA